MQYDRYTDLLHLMGKMVFSIFDIFQHITMCYKANAC